METNIILDNAKNEVIIITNEDGSQLAMLKSIYDEMIANQQNGTIS